MVIRSAGEVVTEMELPPGTMGLCSCHTYCKVSKSAFASLRSNVVKPSVSLPETFYKVSMATGPTPWPKKGGWRDGGGMNRSCLVNCERGGSFGFHPIVHVAVFPYT
jgi:hypothetical protein